MAFFTRLSIVSFLILLSLPPTTIAQESDSTQVGNSDQMSHEAVAEAMQRVRKQLVDKGIPVPQVVADLSDGSVPYTPIIQDDEIRGLIGFGNSSMQIKERTDKAVRRVLERLAPYLSLKRGWTATTKLDRLDAEQTVTNKIRYRQRHLGKPVFDAVFNVLLDPSGTVVELAGAPWRIDKLPTIQEPAISESKALSLAVTGSLKDSKTFFRPDQLFAKDAELGYLGRKVRLVWRVQVRHKEGLGLENEVLVDAQNGQVLRRTDLIGYAEPLDVRYLNHPAGVNIGTGSLVTSINVNPEELNGEECLVRLQRLGSGRARMWNARLSGGTNTSPVFSSTMALSNCNDLSDIDLFKKDSSASADEFFRFNEQSAYVRAQQFKTQLDNWGRAPGGSYGYHYPVDSDRDVNVEIVVNGDADRENDWCNTGVMHGCFRSSPPDDWFPGVEDPKAVFLFNSSGNSGSPQFVGAEYTASYSIIAHEVGHFISWSYGRWDGATSNESGSLNEGMSMALTAVWGKARWPNELNYNDSLEVTTGSRISGNQWSHHAAGAGSLHDNMNCESTNRYQLAWPWVEAIWELANNTNINTGDSIWTSDSAAIANTADFLMDLLYTQAGVSDRDWNTIANRMISHQILRHIFGREQGALANFESFSRVVEVLDHHGLFDNCQ